LDPDKVNVNGGAIALGHPLGCTGAKLTASILRELVRRNGRYGMVTMCVGGGMGAQEFLNVSVETRQVVSVMTESEVFDSVTGSGSTDFGILARVLNRHGAWCLIRGLAVNCYVEPVFTLDADSCCGIDGAGHGKVRIGYRGFLSAGISAFAQCRYAWQ